MLEGEMLLWIHITLKESIHRPRVGKNMLCVCVCVEWGGLKSGEINSTNVVLEVFRLSCKQTHRHLMRPGIWSDNWNSS